MLIFKVILVSIFFFIYNLLVCSHHCNFIKEFNNFFYLPILIDNGTWQAKAGIFYALKPFIECNSKPGSFFFFYSIQHIFPFCYFPYFGTFLLNNAYHAFKFMLTEKLLKPYLCSIMKLPKITSYKLLLIILILLN